MDLVSLRRKVEVQFPDDTWHLVEPLRGHGKALLRSFQLDPQNAEILLELLRLAVPDATDAQFDLLSPDEDVPRILAAADGKSALVEAFLKNVESDGAALGPSPTQLSSPTTSSSISSASLPEATDSLGNQSSISTGTTPSLDSLPSTSSIESKASSESSERSSGDSL